uniref:Uncharacterized protein n=1 Tax=Rhodococcus sp. NS1 TaxID=402236 RepID=A0A097SR00_9NOCA|nr:hypothetical protein LRS1606.520 [Rhodococcus sp. NS1]
MGPKKVSTSKSVQRAWKRHVYWVPMYSLMVRGGVRCGGRMGRAWRWCETQSAQAAQVRAQIRGQSGIVFDGVGQASIVFVDADTEVNEDLSFGCAVPLPPAQGQVDHLVVDGHRVTFRSRIGVWGYGFGASDWVERGSVRIAVVVLLDTRRARVESGQDQTGVGPGGYTA